MQVTLPEDYPRIFGQNFAKRNAAPVVVLGDQHYTKYDLGLIGAPHIQAAREVDRVLKQLGVKDLTDLVKHYSPEDFVEIKKFGITAFYVLTCILRHSKVSINSFYRSKITVSSLQDQVRKGREGTRHKKRKRRAA